MSIRGGILFVHHKPSILHQRTEGDLVLDEGTVEQWQPFEGDKVPHKTVSTTYFEARECPIFSCLYFTIKLHLTSNML